MEKEMATHASILAWRIPLDRRVWQAAVHGVPKSQTWLSNKAHAGALVVARGIWFPDPDLALHGEHRALATVSPGWSLMFILENIDKHNKSHLQPLSRDNHH